MNIRIPDFPYRPEPNIIKGTTFIYTFTIKSIQEGESVTDALPIDLTGHDFTADLTVSGRGTEIATYSIGDGITIPDPENGTVIIRIEASETANFATCCHELRVNWENADETAIIRRILHLKINVSQ